MGSYLTYETACLLKSKYNIEPSHMFVSGASSVHVSKPISGFKVDIRSFY